MKTRLIHRGCPLGLIGLALLAGLLSLNARADDGCRDDPLFTGCDLLSDQIILPFPMETRHFGIYWELRQDNDGAALALYRKLVARSQFDMPDKPALMMYIVHLASPYEAAPAHITRYDEGNLMMRVKLKQPGYPEEDGWYNMYMPVNDRGAYDSGLEQGYPKYLADVDFSFSPAEGTPESGSVTATLEDGRITTQIEWIRDSGAPYTQDLDEVTRFADFHYSLALSHRGPDRVRSRLSTTNSMAPPGQDVTGLPEPGWAKVTMDDFPQSWDAFNPLQIGDLFQPGEALSTLVDFDQIVPAAYLHQQMLLVFTIDHMGNRPDWQPPPGTPEDRDGDAVPNEFDNCPEAFNNEQRDGDRDGVGDACEDADDGNTFGGLGPSCPDLMASLPAFPLKDGFCSTIINGGTDAVAFGVLEGFCAAFATVPGAASLCEDRDGDGLYNRVDNCPAAVNGDQADLDGDAIGDICDWQDDRDEDQDGTVNAKDNCPGLQNFSQADSNGDGVGDACSGAAAAAAADVAPGTEAGSLAGWCLFIILLGLLRAPVRRRGV